MSDQLTPDQSRRSFLERMAAVSALGLMAGCGGQPDGGKAPGASGTSGGSSGPKRLKAAFSNAGLQSTWCSLGKTTAELWGQLLNVDIEWLDGEFDPEKQRNKIDSIAGEDWDFCCFQAVQIDSLAAPVRKLQKRGIPVISMDTLLVEMDKMRETGVWCEVTPDQVGMGMSSTQLLMDRIGGKGKVIHIGGLSAHSGAQGRFQGFENIRAKYSGVEVVGGEVRWCDWKKEKAADTFASLLAQEKEPIAGAFFHSDDMALACVPALKNTIHDKMVITAVDGQREGLEAVKKGVMAGTTVNPVCLIHRTALIVGQFIVRNGEKPENVPLEIITPGPLVANDTPEHQRVLESMFYLADPLHCLT